MQSEFPPRLAIFDLGNVVFGATFDPAFEEWAKLSGKSVGEIKRAFTFDADFEAFERGALSGADFHRSLCGKLGCALSYGEFVAGWNAIYGDVFAEVALALKQLKGKITVVAFTNTNEIHCLVWPERYREVLQHFDHIFISSELGLRKPEEEGFVHVLNACGVSAQEALFFDDFMPNVLAARAIGIRAYHVEDPQTLIGALQELNLIDQ